MSLAKQIDNDYITAYKAKDQQLVDVLRLLKTAAKNQQIELRRELTDDEVFDVIQKQAKQRQDSIEQFNAANRSDLAQKEELELNILKRYLPEPISEAELDNAISDTISQLGATDMKSMGAVIAKIMADYKGRVDGKQVSSKVKASLTSK